MNWIALRPPLALRGRSRYVFALIEVFNCWFFFDCGCRSIYLHGLCCGTDLQRQIEPDHDCYKYCDVIANERLETGLSTSNSIDPSRRSELNTPALVLTEVVATQWRRDCPHS